MCRIICTLHNQYHIQNSAIIFSTTTINFLSSLLDGCSCLAVSDQCVGKREYFGYKVTEFWSAHKVFLYLYVYVLELITFNTLYLSLMKCVNEVEA